MKTAQLSGSSRANVGKKDANALRNQGLVPAVLYGTGEQTHFSVKENDINKIVFSPDVYKVELDIDGKKHSAIIRELQQHPVKDTIQHVDFYEVTDKKPIKIGLPVRLEGSARGVLAGGRLLQVFRKLRVFGLAKDLPDAIVVNITDLRIGQSIRVKNVEIPNVTVLDPANAVVVSIKKSRNSVDDSADDAE
ncbi:MAG: 50S ribosomal protein L25 [Crocinitomicaceae bacterium]|nr:50S ribosomal protein L25 [Crocinitomicaceae bacterium]